MKITGMPKHVKSALQKVIAARAAWETVSEIERETKAEILKDNAFFEEESGKLITEEHYDFLMSEAEFARYCHLVYVRNLEKGLDSGGEGLNFYHIKEAMFKAEDAYIDAIAADIPQYTPDVVNRLKSNPKWRDEFFKITGINKAGA